MFARGLLVFPTPTRTSLFFAILLSLVHTCSLMLSCMLLLSLLYAHTRCCTQLHIHSLLHTRVRALSSFSLLLSHLLDVCLFLSLTCTRSLSSSSQTVVGQRWGLHALPSPFQHRHPGGKAVSGCPGMGEGASEGMDCRGGGEGVSQQ